MSYIFEKVKKNISFEEVARDFGIEFNQNNKTICPFHDDHNPSLSLHPSGDYAKCFVCDTSVDSIELEYRLGNHPNRFEACKALNERFSLNLNLNGFDKEKAEKVGKAHKLLSWYCDYAHKALLNNKEAQAFLSSKGITVETIKAYKIGYIGKGWLSDKLTSKSKPIAIEIGLLRGKGEETYDSFRNCIVFPVWVRGRIASIWTRKFPDDGNERNPKWRGLPTSEFMSSKPIAWVENLQCDKCVVTEGITDALAFISVGIPVCALLGKAITSKNQNYFNQAKAKLYFALDPDEAGREAAYRLAREYKGFIVDLGHEKDPDEVLAEIGIEAFRNKADTALKNAWYYLDVVIEREQDYKEPLKEIAKLEFEGEREGWIEKLSEKSGISPEALKKDL